MELWQDASNFNKGSYNQCSGIHPILTPYRLSLKLALIDSTDIFLWYSGNSMDCNDDALICDAFQHMCNNVSIQ